MFAWLAAKSSFALSVTTMLPSVVHAGVVAFEALSAEMFVPDDAGVTVTGAAGANFASASTHPSATRAMTIPRLRMRAHLRLGFPATAFDADGASRLTAGKRGFGTACCPRRLAS